jgi:hypothetical protein
LTWKDHVPQDIEEQWLKWQNQISELDDIKIKRVLIPGGTPENHKRQLHVFVDTSQDVYSAVAYMQNAGETVVHRFVQAKSRLKPVKAAHTIPCMKLSAAEMGFALVKKLVAILDIQHKDIHSWTDSGAIHDWLRVKTRTLQVFVKKTEY